MKIVQISTFVNGGAGIAAFRLHSSLMRQPDIESEFLQKTYIPNKKYAEDNHIHTAPIGHSYLLRARKKFNLHSEHFQWNKLRSKPRNYEVATFATTSFRLEELPLVKDADIIHLHWVAEFINYPTFFKNIKQPIVWTLHDMNPFMGLFHYEEDEIRNNDIWNYINKKVLEQKIKAIHRHNNVHIVSPSLWMKERAKKSEALGKYPHEVIPHGIDLSQYPKLNKQHSKSELGINNSLKTIVFVASSTDNYRKGFDLLIDAINLKNIKFNLISVGGPKIQLNDNINHIHYERINDVAKLNTIYSAGDITIIPSREEAFNLVMIESFANGTPVLSFSTGGMAEHVKTGVTGILEYNTNSASLGDDIGDFLNNKYNFDHNIIRQYAFDNFSDKLQTEKYIQLYKKILDK